MRYFLIEFDNDYCGCDEKYVVELEEEPTEEEVRESYSFADGLAFMDDEDLEEYDFYTDITEVSEEEYARLKAEDGIRYLPWYCGH